MTDLKYNQQSVEELKELREKFIDARLNAKNKIGKTILFIFGIIALLGGIGYMFISGLNVYNVIVMLFGGGVAYIWIRDDNKRKYYEDEIKKINQELESR